MVEDEVDKYKQKAEETGDLRRYIKALEEQNTSLLERSHQVEHEYRKVLAFKTLMDSYRQQVQQLESTNMEIQKETDRLDAQVASLTDQSNYLEGERDRNIEQLQLLEDYIKELELVGTGVTLDKVLMTDEPMELHMQDKIEDNLMETNEHKNTLAERDQLRQELVKIRNGIPGSLSDQGQSVVVFRSHLLDLKKEATYLKIQTARLETKVTQGTSSVAKDPVTFQQYKVELGRIQDQLDRLVNITKIQYHDTNRMLVEANYLDGINNQSSNNGNELGLSNNDLKTIQEQTADLQTHLIHLQEDINIIQGSTWKVRDMIKLYGLLLQEMAARFALCQDSEEPSYLVSSTPRSKEEEQNLIKKQIHGVRLQSKKEQQLIISSWYDLVHKNHREMTGLSIRSTPSSWLGRQRKLLDSHLRQKVC
ncbi:hypothetical protein BC941DRAFT_357911 [Chlamydoabsidia padenii]|nr:hypothetical protein BC941DRAFT_357911 [Chlamydoabsidia padenii]